MSQYGLPAISFRHCWQIYSLLNVIPQNTGLKSFELATSYHAEQEFVAVYLYTHILLVFWGEHLMVGTNYVAMRKNDRCIWTFTCRAHDVYGKQSVQRT